MQERRFITLARSENSSNAQATAACLAHASVSSVSEVGLTVRVVRDTKSVEELRPAWIEWRGHRDADVDVYQTLLACRQDAAEPYIIVVERNGKPDAALIGNAATTTVTERIGYWTARISRVKVLTFIYGGFLGNQSDENSKSIVCEIERSLQNGDADVAVLSYLREESPLYRFAASVPSSFMRDHFPVSYKHWMIDFPQTPEEGIYTALSREHRSSQKEEIRKSKKFKSAFPDLELVRFKGNDGLEKLLSDAETVAATTYQRGLGVGFSNDLLIRSLLTLEAEKGWLRGHVLYAGGRPCAFEIGCLYNGVFLGEYLGHDPAFSKYAPGTYILTQVIEGLDQEKVTAIDWGIGDASYKRRFGNKCWNESTIYLYAPTWVGMWAKTVRTAAVLINTAGKSVLERAKLAGTVKKLWRKRAARDNAGASSE